MQYLNTEDEAETQEVHPARDAERCTYDVERVEHEKKVMVKRASAPIGVFDSGAGGLTVLSALRQELPYEDYIYLGDTAHCPYGVHNDAEIVDLAIQASRFLIAQGVKIIVVACNTASQAALATLRATFTLPFVGVVPAVKPAARATRSGRIGVAATNQAVKAAYLRQLIDDFAEGIEVYAVGCPELVTLVEHGELHGPVVDVTLRHALQPLRARDIDVLVLGCTHFPALRPAIEQAMGKRVQVIDSGAAVARHTHIVLEAEGATHPNQLAHPYKEGDLQIWCSGDAAAFSAVASSVLGFPVTARHVTL